MEDIETESLNGLAHQMKKGDSEPAKKRLPVKIIVTVICMAVTDAFAGLYFGLLIPFFPTKAEEKGASAFMVGLVFSSFELVNVFITPVMGKLIVKTGSRFIYSTGVLTCGVCSALFGILDFSPPGATFITMSIITRMFEGAGMSAYVTATYAIIATLFPENAGMAMGMLTTCKSTGFLFGPLVGGAIYEAAGYMMTFVYAAIPLFVVGVIGAVLIQVNEGDTRKSKKVSMLDFVRTPRVIVIGLFPLAVCGYPLGAINATISLQLEKFNISPVITGAIISSITPTYLICTSIMGRFGDKYPSKALYMLAAAAFVSALCFFVLGPAPFLLFIPRESVWRMIITQLVMGVCFALNSVAFSQLLLTARDKGLPEDLSTRGMVGACYSFCTSLGNISGPLIGGLLYQSVGWEWETTVIGLIGLLVSIVTIVYQIFFRSSKHSSEYSEIPSSNG